jgi:hypothetical protein
MLSCSECKYFFSERMECRIGPPEVGSDSRNKASFPMMDTKGCCGQGKKPNGKSERVPGSATKK